MRIFVDMDGTLAKWNNVEFEQLFEKGYYRNLEPDMEILNEVNNLIRQGEDVYILSAYLTESDYAKNEKQEWVKQYLPELPEEKQIFVPYGTNKAKYLKEHYSPITNTDYLIDDYTKNLQEWKEYGGIGVKYLNGINHTRATWKGLMINEEYNDFSKLSNVVLSEKLKQLNIILFNRIELDNINRSSFRCYYNGYNYYVGTDLTNSIQDDINNIKNILDSNNAQLIPPTASVKKYFDEKGNEHSIYPEDINYFGMAYFNRHYPTISQCNDFEVLCKELPSTILDDIEYTIYLYDKTDKLPYYSEIGENYERISKKYIEWYESLITTKDLLDELENGKNIEDDFDDRDI